MDPPLRDLRCFLAVAEELHFSRAADRLFISQPALSRQIRRLEHALSAKLFDRNPRVVRLTPAGEALAPVVRELLETWDRGQAAVHEAATAERATLKVGLATRVGRRLVAGIRAVLAAKDPAVRLRFRHVGWDDPTAGLLTAVTDVALAWLPLPDTLVSSRVLFTEARSVLLPADHALAGRSDLELSELEQEPFLALPETAGLQRDFWLAARERSAHPAIAGDVSSAEETFEAVAGHAGLALVAAGNAALYPHPDVVAVPVRGIPPAELAVAWRAGDDRRLVTDFVDAAYEVSRSRTG